MPVQGEARGEMNHVVRQTFLGRFPLGEEEEKLGVLFFFYFIFSNLVTSICVYNCLFPIPNLQLTIPSLISISSIGSIRP